MFSWRRVSSRRQRMVSKGLDAGEITDKGYVNQRQVLVNRSTLVELLYAQPTSAYVIVAGGTA